MFELGLRSPPVHPEVGYLAPSTRVRRVLRLAAVVVASLVVASLVGRIANLVPAERSDAGLTFFASDDAPTAEAVDYSVAPFPYFRPKSRSRKDHPYGNIPIGNVRAFTTDDPPPKEDVAIQAYGLVAEEASGGANLRTVTVRDGRGIMPPRVVAVPIERR